MNIPLKTWMKYKDKLAAIDRRAEVEMISFVQSIGGYGDHVNECLDYAFALATKYGEAAGAAACELYEAVAAASGITLEAMPAATATYEEVAKSLNGIHKISNDPAKLSQGVSRLVKRTAADTTLQNAVRDGAYFAWVPSGDTCAFCLMLASNGWRKAGKKTIKGDHAEHIHANCDCQYAVTFDPLSGVEGYDPAEYEAIFDGIDGDWNKKINVVRQRQYAANPEKPRAQHKAAYARRQEREYGLRYGMESINVDEKEILSPHYSGKFMGITENDNTCSEVCKYARQALQDNSGSVKESMYLVDADSGDLIAAIDREEDKIEKGVIYTDEFKEKLQFAKDKNIRIIALHNHAEGLPPSPDDFKKAYENGYDKGIAVGHNGQVYEYKNTTVPLTEEQCDNIWSAVLQLYVNGMDIDRACKTVYNPLGLDYTIR